MKLKSFVKQYKGSSFPTLILDDNDNKYILKMKGAGNGAISLVAEFIDNRVSSLLNWNVPNAYWIEIKKDFPWTFGTDEFDDILTKSYGWNLAIENIEYIKCYNSSFDEINNSEILNKIVTIDYFLII